MTEKGPNLRVTRSQIETHLRLVQDVDLPYELFSLIADARRLAAYGTAVTSAIASRPNARVVCHGPGAILWSMTAAAGGATVAVAEPGTYLAALIRDVVRDNGFSSQISVVCGGVRDLPHSWRQSADLVVLDTLDPALLGHGLLGNARWAQVNLLAPKGALIPCAATIYTAPGELILGPQCDIDLHLVDEYRGVAPNAPAALIARGWRALAPSQNSATLNFATGAEAAVAPLAFCVEKQGTFSALASWYGLDLDGVNQLTNAPDVNDPHRKQAVSFLEAPAEVDTGETLAFETSLSGATGLGFTALGRGRMQSYGRVRPTLPSWHFPMLESADRNEAFVGAIRRALDGRSEPRVLDIGAGSGLLAIAAATAGAAHVTACEMVPHIAELAQKNVALNGVTATVDILSRASYDLTIPEHLSERASLLVSETVDHGLLGEGFLTALAHARKFLLTTDAQVIPCAATLYITPIDLHTDHVGGFDMHAIDQLRLGHYTGLQLEDTPHVLLADPQPVYHFDFQAGAAKPAQSCFNLPITRAGVFTAMAVWFDLQLDAHATLSTAPTAGVRGWDQGIVFADQTIEVSPGDILPVWCNHNLEQISVYADPSFVGDNPHRTWPPRRALWAMGLRTDATSRTAATRGLMDAMRATEPAQLERIWQALNADDPQLAWLRRDVLADLYAQAGHAAEPHPE